MIRPQTCENCGTTYQFPSSFSKHKKNTCRRKCEKQGMTRSSNQNTGTQYNIENLVITPSPSVPNVQIVSELEQKLALQAQLIKELHVTYGLAEDIPFLKSDYVYLMQHPEFIRMKEKIYKVGRTSDIVQRKNQYPKGTIVLFFWRCDDGHLLEKLSKKSFNEHPEITLHSGSEMFAGNVMLMKKIINDLHDTLHAKVEVEEEKSAEKPSSSSSSSSEDEQ